jgi:hypothetical protein
MNLEKIIQKIQDTFNSQLIAFALVGSRAGNFSRPKSDYDFLGIVSKDSPLEYIDLKEEEKEISIKVEGKNFFEKQISSPLGFYHESSSIVWLPYYSIRGQDYLENIECKSRRKLVDIFIRSLPKNKIVRIKAKDIAEFPLIKESLVWPMMAERVQRIVFSSNNPLEKVIPKYQEILDEKGFEKEGEFFFIENNNPPIELNYGFRKKLFVSGKKYFTKKQSPGILNFLRGGAFILGQIPERAFNLFYKFPILEDKGDFLEYKGPSMKEFIENRRYLEFLRTGTKKIKSKMLE